MRAPVCGLLETPNNFFIDHLAPLCALLDAPILSSHLNTKLFYQNYYPGVQIVLKKWNLLDLLTHYQSAIYSFNPEPSFQELLSSMKKEHPDLKELDNPFKFIYHFHGCSDKGYHCTWVDPRGHFKEIDLLFLYGARMRQILEDKELYHLPKSIEEIGNYRLAYYKKYQSFFDERADRDVFSKFKKKKPILLYAPTWQDNENSSSFHQLSDETLKDLSKEFNLLIKLHPNMTQKTKTHDPTKTIERLNKLLDLEDALILPFYPLIYPLLNRTDLYLGDHSSVGYDALACDVPLFFLNSCSRPLTDKSTLLFQCGPSIQPKDFGQLPKRIHEALNLSPYQSARKKLLEYAFGKTLAYDALKAKVEGSLNALLDSY